jgi:hypothetical protein
VGGAAVAVAVAEAGADDAAGCDLASDAEADLASPFWLSGAPAYTASSATRHATSDQRPATSVSTARERQGRGRAGAVPAAAAIRGRRRHRTSRGVRRHPAVSGCRAPSHPLRSRHETSAQRRSWPESESTCGLSPQSPAQTCSESAQNGAPNLCHAMPWATSPARHISACTGWKWEGEGRDGQQQSGGGTHWCESKIRTFCHLCSECRDP